MRSRLVSSGRHDLAVCPAQPHRHLLEGHFFREAFAVVSLGERKLMTLICPCLTSLPRQAQNRTGSPPNFPFQ